MIKFIVNTRPKPQQRHRSNGRYHYDPSSKVKKDFLKSAGIYRPKKPISKNIDLEFIFCYKRPKNHYRMKNKKLALKIDAPQYKGTKADIDNIAKLYIDAMNGVFYKDDCQIVNLTASKIFGSDNYVYVKITHTKKFIEKQ